MKFAIIFFLALSPLSFLSFGQEQDGLYYMTLEEARLYSPDSVFALRLSKQKLANIPEEIFQYRNLKALDLSKNKLTEIPQNLNVFTQLEILNLGKNRLQLCPIVICSMPNLKHLYLNENIITNLPECIQYLSQLETLDIFNTRIESFPETMALLKNLKMMDARGMLYGPIFQAHWIEALPNTEIKFDLPCNCME